MKLATLRRPDGSTTAARLDGDSYVLLDASDVGALLAAGDLAGASSSDGERVPADGADLAPVIPHPGKVICVGLNYREHIKEMGRDFPDYPALFAKFEEGLIGPYDDVPHPPETEKLDWECELAIIIGAPVRRADEEQAAAAIAGFAVLNDVSCRDWQTRTNEWLQGKMWEGSTPLGPHLTTPDELPGGTRPALRISTTLDGQVVQQDNTGDLLFDPVFLVQYISTTITLKPGDVISTGTCGGVGVGRKPPVFMHAGQKLVTEIEGLGRLENTIVDEVV